MPEWAAAARRAVVTAGAALAAFIPAATPAAPQRPSPALIARAADLIPVLNGGGTLATLFTARFLADVPPAKLRTISSQLTARFGAARRIAAIEPDGANAATVRVEYQRAVVAMRIDLEAVAPNRIAGLRITGAGTADTSLSSVAASLKALPGTTALSVARLGEGAPQPIVASDADRPLAIGSSFKLVVLAELVRAVNAGERGWSDTIVLDGKPLADGVIHDWPAAAPITLHSLAALMVSRSDNAATDVLLAALGRDKVAAMQAVVGIADPARNEPFLSTLELFKIKGIAGSGLAARWEAADAAGRRALLDGDVAAADPRKINLAPFANRPTRIATIEWFASPADLVRVLDWLRRHTETGAGAAARDILAINPGIGADGAARWAYLGYKGGSEPGVIAMSFLLRAKGGGWYAVSAAWNDSAAAIDEARFAALMASAVALAAP